MMRREQENAGATSASRMEIGAGGKRGDGSRGRRARRRDGLGTRRSIVGRGPGAWFDWNTAAPTGVWERAPTAEEAAAPSHPLDSAGGEAGAVEAGGGRREGGGGRGRRWREGRRWQRPRMEEAAAACVLVLNWQRRRQHSSTLHWFARSERPSRLPSRPSVTALGAPLGG
uniref:Uncharacterized protein n=1 Tax=Oryza nivara TaxID=4536 RepID=A0A0E0GJ89_ORYNI